MAADTKCIVPTGAWSNRQYSLVLNAVSVDIFAVHC